jgi:D-alanine-D-alanine ligase
MAAPKKRVVILFGGKSGEHEVSIVSATGVYKALDRSKYDVSLVGIDKEGRWLLPQESHLLAQSSNPKLVNLGKVAASAGLLPAESNKTKLQEADVILPIIHGTNGEDGTLQGLLELANLPYAGSGVLGSSVCMDKDMAKRVLRDAGIPVVPFLTARLADFQQDPEKVAQEAARRFGYPYFVKPANAGSSVGVNKVKNAQEARKKFEDAFRFDSKVLVEEAIEAREIECAVLGNERPQASILGEIVPLKEFYSYEAKYVDEQGAELKIPADNLSPELTEQIRQMAIKAFTVLECAGMARVDFFVDRRDGRVFLNELNTIPGFTPISMYPKLWEASGLPYPKLLDRLIELALERHAEKTRRQTSY